MKIAIHRYSDCLVVEMKNVCAGNEEMAESWENSVEMRNQAQMVVLGKITLS